MAITVLGAIREAYLADPALRDSVTALYLGVGPASAVLPYAVLNSIAGTREFTTGEEPTIVDSDEVQVSVFAATAEAASGLQRAWKAGLHHAALPIDGGRLIEIYCSNYLGPLRDPQPESGPHGADVWYCTVDFTVTTNAG